MRSTLTRLLLLRAFSDPRVVTVTLGAMFALLGLRAAFEPVSDPDVWWVAAVGRDAVLRGHIPRTNVYSYVDPNVGWVMHEWLLAAPFALGLSHFGPAFFTALGLLSGATILTGVLRCTVSRARHLAGGAWLAMSVLLGCREALVSPRPGYLALAFPVGAVLLAFRPRLTRRDVALSLALTLLWTNTHGSFPFGLFLFAAGAVDAGDRSFRRLWTLAAAAVTTLANPYGLRLHGLVLRYLVGGDAAIALVHENITEFAPLWRFPWPFVNAQNLGVVALLTALALSSLRGPHRGRGLTALFALALGVLHARHLMLAIVTGASVLWPALDALLDRALDDEKAPVSKPVRAIRTLGPGLSLAAVVLAVVARDRAFGDWIAPRLGGPDVARLASEIPRNLRVYAPFEASAVLVWRAAPRGIRVLTDPRNDCFRASTLALGFGLERGTLDAPQIAAAMDGTNTEGILVPEDHPAGQWVAHAAGWRRSAGEGVWGLWLRDPEGDRARPSRD